MRETIVVNVGPEHLKQLDRIVDPLVVTDVATVMWAPHGHPEAVDALLVDRPGRAPGLRRRPRPGRRARARLPARDAAYVVDLAWLRTTPWRERIAATFDPPNRRPELGTISSGNRADPRGLGGLRPPAARLADVAPRLAPRRAGPPPGHAARPRAGTARRGRDRAADHRADEVPGLAGIDIRTASGTVFALERGTGGLTATRDRERDGTSGPGRCSARPAANPGSSARGCARRSLRDPTYSARAGRGEGAGMGRSSAGDPGAGRRSRRSRTTRSCRTARPARSSRRAATSSGCACPASTGRACSARCSTARPAAFPRRRWTTRSRNGRRYVPGTNVLETTWGTKTGWIIVRDVLLVGPWHHTQERSKTHRRSPTDYDAEHVLLRTMRCVNGTVEMHLECEPVLGYGTQQVTWDYTGTGYNAAGATSRAATSRSSSPPTSTSASRPPAPAPAGRCATATRRTAHSWQSHAPADPWPADLPGDACRGREGA